MSVPTASHATTRHGHAPWWFSLTGRMLRPWLKIKRDPVEPAALLHPDMPVCYVIERHGFSDQLILGRACQEAGLPSPSQPLPGLNLKQRFSMFSMARRDGWLWGRTRKRASDAVLVRLLHALDSVPDADVQLVPVSIYAGRAPARDSGWFRVLFSENWVVVGRFRRLLALLLNGRNTMVHFAEPISLRQAVQESPDLLPPRMARKLSRVLRIHFRRIRAAVIGPDLSHRRTVVDSVLNATPVREAITSEAIKHNLSVAVAQKRARKMVLEIAADYSHPVVRSASFLLTWFWNKLYDGVDVRHFDQARAAAPGHEVVYVPSHRSHADYLLLSYKLHVSGVVPPHIAAGINLNLPLVGSILRRGGAFFMRRTFRGSALYSTIFKEYLAQLIDRGVPIEYFIEGGRSRTGRLLEPKAGMLSMTVRAFLRAPRRPVMFQPVYIGYERLMEGNTYAGELSGQPKQSESWLSLLNGARKVLRQHYGHVTLSFGEPVKLSQLLDDTGEQWRQPSSALDTKPEWFNTLIDDLAERIQINVNAAAEVNPVNLLALILLATPKHAMAESDLLTQIDLTRAVLTELRYSDRVSVSDASAADIIAHGEGMGWIRRVEHALDDVLLVDNDKAVLLSYFRNNVLHLLACAGWVASCFLNNRRMSRASVLRLGRIIYPFVQGELFLRWDEHGFTRQLQATINLFIRHGLLDAQGEGRLLERGPGQGDAAFQMKTLARCLLQAFERYYIAIAALVKNGQGSLSAGELESTCTMTAQRLSLLHELNGPEFFDKSLFRGFIRKLRDRGVVWTDADGKLEFDPALAELVGDARLILSRELRYSILKITPGSENGENTDHRPNETEAD